MDESPRQLLHFGLAPETTDTDVGGGTVRYAFPEVIAGEPAAEADEVWSLAVVRRTERTYSGSRLVGHLVQPGPFAGHT